MKRFSLALIALLAMSVLSVKAQVASILLQHNGAATMYSSDQLSTAITAAAAGDTIYLSNGTFSGNITISKAITIIGAGGVNTGTKLDGDVTIAIAGTLTSTLMEGVYVTGDISVTKAVNGLKIKSTTLVDMSFSANVENMLIEQSYIRGTFTASSVVKSGYILNSRLYTVQNSCINVSLVNCNIYHINNSYSNNFAGTLQNCIIFTFYSGGSCATGTKFTNCLYYYEFGNVTYDACYKYGSNDLLDSSVNCTLDAATLQSNGYLGNDGTIVGIYGGTTGYSLYPKVPTVESSTIKVDTENQKLNVSLKVKAN